MRRLDELHLGHPFAGSRMLRDFLNCVSIGRRYVASFDERIGIASAWSPSEHRAIPRPATRSTLLRAWC